LIVRTVHAIGKVAGGFRDRNDRFLHKLRLSDYTHNGQR
jgi:hypothetical protein